ncbi:hypothetical protein Hypma_007139 [Hypsizygus marmoreus]|uniref:Uncharacterized protein n=1 Tax=Hypsizygus marmoreus TaxID=39966 RepID=A0A369K9P5_HYPMA|nr:hypothetical protein Hypma_007139 [Hypsizygus marmoreus]
MFLLQMRTPTPEPIAPLSPHLHHKSFSLSSVHGPHLHSLRRTSLSNPFVSIALTPRSQLLAPLPPLHMANGTPYTILDQLIIFISSHSFHGHSSSTPRSTDLRRRQRLDAYRSPPAGKTSLPPDISHTTAFVNPGLGQFMRRSTTAVLEFYEEKGSYLDMRCPGTEVQFLQPRQLPPCFSVSSSRSPAPTSLRASSVALAFTMVYDPNAEKAEISKVLLPALAFDVRGFDRLALGCDCDESHGVYLFYFVRF